MGPPLHWDVDDSPSSLNSVPGHLGKDTLLIAALGNLFTQAKPKSQDDVEGCSFLSVSDPHGSGVDS